MGLLDILDKEIESVPIEENNRESKTSLNDIRGIINEGATSEGRNVSLTRVAGVLRAAGLPQSFICDILLSVNTSTGMNLDRREVETIARSISKYQPKAENRQPDNNDLVTIEQASKMHEELVKKFGTFKIGMERFDNAMSTFFPGEVLTIAGRSGTGKTTIGIELTSRIAYTFKGYCLFASLEMNPEAVFFRMANMVNSKLNNTPKNAQDTFKSLKDTSLRQMTIQSYNDKILLVNKDSLTIEQIERYYHIASEKIKVQCVLIDYLGYMNDCQSGTNYEKVSRIAKGIKALAKRLNTRIILLCQTSRAGEDGTVPVQLHHLRDSGAIEESADYIMGIWHAQDETRLHCELLKCRHGHKGEKWDYVNSGLNFIEEEFLQEETKRVKKWGKA